MRKASLGCEAPNVESMQAEFYQELISIAEWWLDHVIDLKTSRIVGEVGDTNKANRSAGKSAVYTTRLLWFFSEIARVTQNEVYSKAADLMYGYLNDYFLDKVNGGIYWEIGADSKVINPRKQVYAQAFYIYALCAYYNLTGTEEALQRADEIHALLETYAHDDNKKGYIEALSRDWGSQDDLRLSEKEPNLPKTMNTHLHVLEAYTGLHAIRGNEKTEQSLRRVLDYFYDYLIDHKTCHLNLFFDDDWNNQSPGYSYGHDIESSWLIWEAAETLGDNDILSKIKSVCIRIVDACLQEGSGDYGELVDGFNFAKNQLVPEHIWWVQAEALVGYLNAYQLTAEHKYLAAFDKTWSFIKQYQKNTQYGEWHWFSKLDLKEEEQQYKAGFWKAPYHNGRAMMEVCDRFRQIRKNKNTS